MDVFTPEKRSEVMSRIRSTDTKPEITVRKYLYKSGIRYRKNDPSITGKPDISIKKYKVAIFINGCFWHGHENCKYFVLPKSNRDFWKEKINRNRERDSRVEDELEKEGWNVFVVWECELKRNFEETLSNLLHELSDIIKKQV